MKYGTLIRVQDVNQCEESFLKVKNLGFESCQLVYKPLEYKIDDAKMIKDIALKHGIEISAFFAGFYDDYTAWEIKYDYKNAGINSVTFGAQRLEYLRKAMPFINALGVTDMIIHAGFIPNDPFENAYAEMLCKVKLLTKWAKDNDINLLLETGGESPITLLRLIKEVDADNLFINLDTGNIIMYGYGNPCEAIMTFGKYIRNMHAKDGLPPTDPYKIGPETAIGKGVVNFRRVFELLKGAGYDRFVTIEREITGQQQTADIVSGVNYLKNIIKEIY